MRTLNKTGRLTWTLAAFAVASMLFIGQSASAAVTTYTSLTAYDLNEDTDNTVGFAGITAANNFKYFGDPGSLTTGDGTTFTTNTGTDLFVIGDNYAPTYDFGIANGSTLDMEGDKSIPGAETTGVTSLTATLPTGYSLPITAVGTNIGGIFDPTTFSVTVTLQGEPAETFTTVSEAVGTSDFIGFISEDGAAIESIEITDTTADVNGFPNFVIDNFTYGDYTGPLVTTPEPASLSLLGVGAVALFYFRRRLQAAVVR